MPPAPDIDFDHAVRHVAALNRPALVAIDGLPVSGKSTLAERLEREYGATTIYLDDFVRPPAAWRGRLTPGFPFGYIRYEAFLAAVESISRGETASYQLFDWASGALGPEKTVRPDGLVLIEGVSALHPSLAPLYDLRFWIDSDPSTTLSAALQRGVGDWETEWRELFMPSVAIYLESDPQSRADYLVAGRGVRTEADG